MDATATDWRTAQECDIYEAAGLRPGDLPKQTRSVASWLAGWDEDIVSGVKGLLTLAWREGYAEGERRGTDHVRTLRDVDADGALDRDDLLGTPLPGRRRLTWPSTGWTETRHL